MCSNLSNINRVFFKRTKSNEDKANYKQDRWWLTLKIQYIFRFNIFCTVLYKRQFFPSDYLFFSNIREQRFLLYILKYKKEELDVFSYKSDISISHKTGTLIPDFHHHHH